MRDNLHSRPEVVAAAFFVDDRLVYLTGRVVRVSRQARVGVALVMPEIEIGLGAIFGDVHFTVLVRVHRTRVEIDVRIELLQRHFEAMSLEKQPDRRRREPFAKRRDHASGHKDELGVLAHTCLFDSSVKGTTTAHGSTNCSEHDASNTAFTRKRHVPSRTRKRHSLLRRAA